MRFFDAPQYGGVYVGVTGVITLLEESAKSLLQEPGIDEAKGFLFDLAIKCVIEGLRTIEGPEDKDPDCIQFTNKADPFRIAYSETKGGVFVHAQDYMDWAQKKFDKTRAKVNFAFGLLHPQYAEESDSIQSKTIEQVMNLLKYAMTPEPDTEFGE